MVLYFTSDVVDPPVTLYMGRDKHENEDLIKYGWDEDVWFHVDGLSSAHVYLRLPTGADYSWTAIDEKLLADCCQLVKANSIEGNKRDNITIVYTPWSNLKKTKGMEIGQVSFHSDKLVRKFKIRTRENPIVNRLNKTKRDVPAPDLARERIEHERRKRLGSAGEARARKEEAERLARERKEREEMKNYKDVLDGKGMVSNAEKAGAYVDPSTGEVDVQMAEEDFM